MDNITLEITEEGPESIVEITVGGASLNPSLTVYQVVEGEGDAAVLQKVFVSWDVVTTEEIEEFKLYKDGTLIHTATALLSQTEYSYNDIDVAFDTEYTYKVVSVGTDGNEYESEEKTITPTRPEEVDRTPPEVISITVSTEGDEKVMEVIFTDVSGDDYDLFEIYYEFDGYEPETVQYNLDSDYLSLNEDGNVRWGLDCSALASGNYTVTVKLRIFIAGGWSDWGATETVNITF